MMSYLKILIFGYCFSSIPNLYANSERMEFCLSLVNGPQRLKIVSVILAEKDTNNLQTLWDPEVYINEKPPSILPQS